MITHTPRSILSASLLSLTLLSACKSEIDEKPKAKVEEAEQPAEKTDAKAEGGEAQDGDAAAKTYALAAGSSVGFIGAKVTGDHKGSFEKLEGSASVEGGKLTALEVTAHVDSMKTDNEDLTAHLKTADFFDAATHPTAKFSLLSATEKAGEGGATHELSGNLEMHGETKKISFPATVSVSDAGVTGKAEFQIDRHLWGISNPGKPDDLIKDEVALQLDLKFE